MTEPRSRFVAHPADAAPVREGHEGAAYYALMTYAQRDLLIERGLLSQAEIDAAFRKLESPQLEWGARLVARAWRDPDYKARLLADGNAAALELGYTITEARLIVVENTPALHNLIVCTLCSCYPIALLGPSPTWYKSEAYRSRVVREPGSVLTEFGFELDPAVQITVWDASAESRYMVLPRRPAGTEDLGEQELAALVTRNGLIGVAPV